MPHGRGICLTAAGSSPPQYPAITGDGNRPSLAKNTLARFTSDGAALLFGLIGGVITARWLGPGGKGAYAALTLLMEVFSQLASLGFGDVAVILSGQRKASIQKAASASLPIVLPAALIGGVVVGVISHLTVGTRGPTLGRAVLVLSFVVPVRALLNQLIFLIDATERVVATSVIRTIGDIVTTASLVVLVIVLPLNLTGAVLAILVASCVELALIVFTLRRIGVSLRPRWDSGFLRIALRLGPSIQVAYLVVILAARLDVLVVYQMAGRAEAGFYSVALTFGQLVIYVSFALAFAAYPRLANVNAAEATWLTAKISRLGLATSALSGALLIILIPIMIPLLFGPAYRSSVPPALVLVAGGFLWSELWLLCRAAVARGQTALQLRAFGVNLIVMISLDFLLVPSLGIMGAALASVAAPSVGLIICLRNYARAGLGDLAVRDLLPRAEDFRELCAFVAGVCRRIGTIFRSN